MGKNGSFYLNCQATGILKEVGSNGLNWDLSNGISSHLTIRPNIQRSPFQR